MVFWVYSDILHAFLGMVILGHPDHDSLPFPSKKENYYYEHQYYHHFVFYMRKPRADNTSISLRCRSAPHYPVPFDEAVRVQGLVVPNLINDTVFMTRAVFHR